MNDENDVELLVEKARQMTLFFVRPKISALCFFGQLGGPAPPHTALSRHKPIIETCKHAIRFYYCFTYILIRAKSKFKGIDRSFELRGESRLI